MYYIFASMLQPVCDMTLIDFRVNYKMSIRPAVIFQTADELCTM